MPPRDVDSAGADTLHEGQDRLRNQTKRQEALENTMNKMKVGRDGGGWQQCGGDRSMGKDIHEQQVLIEGDAQDYQYPEIVASGQSQSRPEGLQVEEGRNLYTGRDQLGNSEDRRVADNALEDENTDMVGTTSDVLQSKVVMGVEKAPPSWKRK